jgi:CRISPR-associated protein Cmr1
MIRGQDGERVGMTSETQGEAPPGPPNMPGPIHRSRRGEAPRETFSIEIETVTPILGGAPVVRQVDEIDVIRVPTIRGHLRFWWRALQRDDFATPADLYRAEAELWGRAADEEGGRSSVELSVEVLRQSQIDRSDVDPNAADGYALWPAREPPAPRRTPGVRFRLTVKAPVNQFDAIKDTVRTWLLFGGYGSRARRGLGSLKLVDHRIQSQWLPSVEDADDIEPADLQREFKESLENLFRRDVFAKGGHADQVPSLSGATLLIGGPYRGDRSQLAWHQAIGWLKEFRQGENFARDRGRAPNRPGRSRWPEADKLRHLTGKYGHQPRYTNRNAAWPRADFGLPIVGRFQGRGEPEPFLLTWQIGEREAKPGEDRIKDRLASPLIVKPLQSVEGFYSCALWLNRSFPPGEIIAVATASSKPLPYGNAPFGFLGTPSDLREAVELNAPFARKADVKTAFLDWLRSREGVVQIAP